jgi:UDP-N-acetylmuramyl-tripeptide synthetase
MQVLNTPQQAAQWLHDKVGGTFSLDEGSPFAVMHTDSRRIQSGDVFLAYAGRQHDARTRVQEVLDQGAVACLVDAPEELASQGAKTLDDSILSLIFKDASAKERQARASDPRVAFMPRLKAQRGWVAAHYYAHPSQSLKVLAVTGTNGKTTCTWWLAQVLTQLGVRCAIAGTLGVGELDHAPLTPNSKDSAFYPLKALPSQQVFGDRFAGGLTTMEAHELQRAMGYCRQEGITHLALEASSIGLSEGRLEGTQIEVAIFTNLTQDHLDYHPDMAAYWEAKKTLFCKMQPKAVVLNLDDENGWSLYGEMVADAQSHPQSDGAKPLIVGYTCELAQVQSQASAWAELKGIPTELALGMSDVLSATELEFHAAKGAWTFMLSWRGQTAPFTLPVLGRYNVSNALAVLGTLLALGVPWQEAIQHGQALQAVRGRMQCIQKGADTPTVVIDYAHTPDALTKVLQSLKSITRSQGAQLWCVMGCGGERDRSKRGLMGAAAQALADHVVLTSDNPRHENPLSIMDDIEQGMSTGRAHRQVDRRLAIEWAIQNAAPRDWVLVAGKGHETYQECDGVKWPFSDQEEVTLALEREHTRRGGKDLIQGVFHG